MDKKCTKCGEELPLEMFHKNKDRKDGHIAYCKKCVKKQKDAYYEKNREKLNKKSKEYYKNNKEKFSEYKKIYAENNKEKLLEHRKQYYRENREKILVKDKIYQQKEENKPKLSEWHKRHYKSHKEQYFIRSANRRSRKKQLPSTLTLEQWEQIKQYFNNRCCYCGKELPLTKEHFIPLNKGGEYTNNNIIPSCLSCNSSKRDKDFFEWYPKYRYYSKKREEFILKYLEYNEEEQQLRIL